jgi:PadR family transcriptional regulator PadR
LALDLFCFIITNQLESNSMKRTFLGEFEEVVLLVLAACGEEAYGVVIWEQLQQQTGRSITISAVHATLYRLEEKGYLSSQLGGATAERGGRRKRFFALTALGSKALLEIQAMRQQLWQAIPDGKLQLIGQ